MADQSFDQARSEAFAGRMMDVLNGASITLMTSIGHQVGLFDVMANLPPATSQQIVEAAGLNGHRGPQDRQRHRNAAERGQRNGEYPD